MSIEEVKRLKTLSEFNSYFSTEEKCSEFLAQIRWNGYKCPHCGHTNAQTSNKGRKLRCTSCWKYYSVTQGTIFHGTRLNLREWFSAIFHVKNDSQGPQWIKNRCGVSQKTAWFMFHRILELSQVSFEDFERINDCVAEVDETYIGPDKAKQSTAIIRKLKNSVKGGVGNRVAFTTVYIRNVGVFGLLHPPYTTVERNKQIVTSILERNCTVYCDKGKQYQWMFDYFKEVQQFDHSKRQFVDKLDKTKHSQSVEGFFKHLKEYLDQFPSVRKKYLQRYYNEFAWRYSTNNFSEITVNGRKPTCGERFLEIFRNVEKLEQTLSLSELKGRDKDEKMIADWQTENHQQQLAKDALKAKRKEKKVAVKIRKEAAQVERDRRKKIKEEREEEKARLKLEFPNGKKRGRKPKPKNATVPNEVISQRATQMSLCFDWEVFKTG